MLLHWIANLTCIKKIQNTVFVFKYIFPSSNLYFYFKYILMYLCPPLLLCCLTMKYRDLYIQHTSDEFFLFYLTEYISFSRIVSFIFWESVFLLAGERWRNVAPYAG